MAAAPRRNIWQNSGNRDAVALPLQGFSVELRPCTDVPWSHLLKPALGLEINKILRELDTSKFATLRLPRDLRGGKRDTCMYE